MPSVFTAGIHAQIFVLAVAFLLAPASPRNLLAAPAPQQTPAPAAAGTRAVGTIKSVVDTTVTLATDSGAELKIVLQPDTKILRVAPGQQDIKQATPIAASDLQTGDRILVRGKTADDAKTLLAISVIAMAKTDVAAKQAKDREEWQRHGLGGIVNAIDPAANTITIGVTVMGEKKNVLIKLSPNTILRRYASDSVKFGEAKPATLDKVRVGDQLRTRGARSPDGAELTADEVVSGTFRNISGTISAIDVSVGTLVVKDLATKTAVTVKVTTDSQLRKLTPPVAQRIAARMKGESPAGAPGAANTNAPANAPAAANAAQSGTPAPSMGQQGAGSYGGQGGGPGGGPSGGQGGDLQQILARMPASNLSDLQKGDAVMIVTTEGAEGGAVTAITLLAGVEPILEASPAGGQSSLLSAWSLGGAPGGDAGAP